MMGVDKVRTVIGIIGKFFFFFFFLGVSRFGLHFFFLYFTEKIMAGRENLDFFAEFSLFFEILLSKFFINV